MRRGFVLAALIAGACATGDISLPDMGPAPAAPAYIADQPDQLIRGLQVNYTQAKVGHAAAPSLLIAQNGRAIRSVRDWQEKRRPEIEALLTENQYGAPPRLETLRLASISMAHSERGVPALDGKALRSQSTIELSGLETRSIDVLLYTPSQALKPSPVVLMINFSPNAVMVDDPAVKETDGWTAEG